MSENDDRMELEARRKGYIRDGVYVKVEIDARVITRDLIRTWAPEDLEIIRDRISEVLDASGDGKGIDVDAGIADEIGKHLRPAHKPPESTELIAWCEEHGRETVRKIMFAHYDSKSSGFTLFFECGRRQWYKLPFMLDPVYRVPSSKSPAGRKREWTQDPDKPDLWTPPAPDTPKSPCNHDTIDNDGEDGLICVRCDQYWKRNNRLFFVKSPAAASGAERFGTSPGGSQVREDAGSTPAAPAETAGGPKRRLVAMRDHPLCPACERLFDRIEELESEVADKKEKNALLIRQMEPLRAKLAAERECCIKQFEKLGEQHNHIAELERGIEATNEGYRKADALIFDLQAKLAAAERERAGQRGTRNYLQRESNERYHRIAELEAFIIELRDELYKPIKDSNLESFIPRFRKILKSPGDGKGDGRTPQPSGGAEPARNTGCDDPAVETLEGRPCQRLNPIDDSRCGQPEDAVIHDPLTAGSHIYDPAPPENAIETCCYKCAAHPYTWKECIGTRGDGNCKKCTPCPIFKPRTAVPKLEKSEAKFICKNCGYNTTEPRCPDCGKLLDVKSPAAATGSGNEETEPRSGKEHKNGQSEAARASPPAPPLADTAGDKPQKCNTCLGIARPIHEYPCSRCKTRTNYNKDLDHWRQDKTKPDQSWIEGRSSPE